MEMVFMENKLKNTINRENMIINILINAFGIQDSGGITILEKMLYECTLNEKYIYYVLVNEHQNISNLLNKFIGYKKINFIKIQKKRIIHRLYFENITFRSLVKEYNISLVYNFSGSSQLLSSKPVLVKVQNLIFYSKKLDEAYKKTNNQKLWLKQVWSKRLIFLSMLKQSKNLEIQSTHVKDALSDFMRVSDKTFFLKNDFSANRDSFKEPKKYNIEKELTFLYIVGPHFAIPHKNMQDFVDAMTELKALGKEFKIKVTLSYEELNNSTIWDSVLNEHTDFLGYLKDKDEIEKLFQDNTVLISTSVIETIGLHIIEGIQNGILCVAPDEQYSKSVYGDDLLKYKLFDAQSLVDVILSLDTLEKKEIQQRIENTQKYIIDNEADKFHSIIDIFDEILEGKKYVKR
jgi:glycosyltransferase involved in cell wall biosynthesis